MYEKTTNDFTVTVEVTYLEEQSEPTDQHFVWAYMIYVFNNSEHQVQLLRRQWYITDAHGIKQSVEGAGVVGEQPILKPKQGFQYTSGTVLHTASGIMEGFYTMQNKKTKETFTIDVPLFSLDSPHQAMRPN